MKDPVYEKLLQEIFQAYFDARKHKRNTLSQLRFEMNLETNLVELADDIYARRYKTSPSYCFIVDYPAKREIFAAGFRDRVVHHLLYNHLSTIFERLFIADCYACRKNFGTHYGIQRLEHHIRSCTDNFTRRAWILKLDIRGYFMSIDKKILYRLLEQQLYTLGQAAITFGYSNLISSYSGGGTTVVTAPPTNTDKTGVALLPSAYWAINANSAHPKEAAELMDWFLEEPSAVKLILDTRGVPFNPDAAALVTPLLTGNSKVAAEYVQSALDAGEVAPPQPNGGANMNQYSQDCESDVLFNKSTPEEAGQTWVDKLGKDLG